MKLIHYFITAICLSITGCNQDDGQKSINPSEIRSQILSLHHKLIDAHISKDNAFFVNNLSDDYVSVCNGEIKHPTADQYAADMKIYIDHTSFSEYRDLHEPIIGFSKDGSIAWSIIQVKVKGTQSQPDGIKKDVDFICAWMTLYERKEDEWSTLAEVSTFK